MAQSVSNADAQDAAERLPARYVHPGQITTGGAETRIVTILGSCIAVCVFDVTAGVGGLSHFVLPGPGGDLPARAGDTAVPLLVDEVCSRGAHRSRLQAKLFGGATISSAFNDKVPLGARNAEAARRALQKLHIDVIAEDLGGRRGRKVVFFPATGAVLVKEV